MDFRERHGLNEDQYAQGHRKPPTGSIGISNLNPIKSNEFMVNPQNLNFEWSFKKQLQSNYGNTNSNTTPKKLFPKDSNKKRAINSLEFNQSLIAQRQISAKKPRPLVYGQNLHVDLGQLGQMGQFLDAENTNAIIVVSDKSLYQKDRTSTIDF
jgi:hypothetical protein